MIYSIINATAPFGDSTHIVPKKYNSVGKGIVLSKDYFLKN